MYAVVAWLLLQSLLICRSWSRRWVPSGMWLLFLSFYHLGQCLVPFPWLRALHQTLPCSFQGRCSTSSNLVFFLQCLPFSFQSPDVIGLSGLTAHPDHLHFACLFKLPLPCHWRRGQLIVGSLLALPTHYSLCPSWRQFSCLLGVLLLAFALGF